MKIRPLNTSELWLSIISLEYTLWDLGVPLGSWAVYLDTSFIHKWLLSRLPYLFDLSEFVHPSSFELLLLSLPTFASSSSSLLYSRHPSFCLSFSIPIFYLSFSIYQYLPSFRLNYRSYLSLPLSRLFHSSIWILLSSVQLFTCCVNTVTNPPSDESLTASIDSQHFDSIWALRPPLTWI